jgi:hypothetical protein
VSKEHFIAAHEQMVEEYLEAHPDATWAQAYEATADGAWDRMRDRMADAIDHYRDVAKERGL